MMIQTIRKISVWMERAVLATAVLAIIQSLETPQLSILNTCSNLSLEDLLKFDGEYFILWTEGFLSLGKFAIYLLSYSSHFVALNDAQSICNPSGLIMSASVVWIITIRLTHRIIIPIIRTIKPAPSDVIARNDYSLRPSISVVFSKRLPCSIQELGYWSVGSVGPKGRLQAHFALLTFFRCYPTVSLEEKLSRVFFCGRLLCHQKSIGGAAMAKRNEIYVSLSNKNKQTDIVKTIHHEFAHLCAKSPTFDLNFKKIEWMSLHKNQLNLYPYDGKGGGSAAIQQGLSSSKPTSDLLQLGFLHQYGKSCFEEDFCSYVDHIFAYPTRLVKWQTNALVQAKTKMVYDYYVGLGAKIPAVIHDLWR